MSHTLPDEDRMYRALLESDSSFEGVFFVGVRTTGIFCRPSCHARKPKRKNVRFYPSAKAALQDGFRPCQLCRPMEPAGTAPGWARKLIQTMHENPDERIRDADLRDQGLDPATVRRWFRKYHGMTFQGYQRAIRISRAFGTIRQGETVVRAAFDSGYDSLSGFSDSFRKLVGRPPSSSAERTLIHVSRLTTPLGPMFAGATDGGICLLEFTDRRMLETQFKRVSSKLNAVVVPGDSPYFEKLQRELDKYFDGNRRSFDVSLVLAGTSFQETVWRELMTIPYGSTRSYRGQAERIGRANAVRAVARANGDNRMSILIPCHRVIGSDGALTGYGGELWRKRYLLDLEAGRG